MRVPHGRGAGRRSAVLLSVVLAIIAFGAAPALGAAEAVDATTPVQGQASRIIVIDPAGHVMLVGNKRRLDAQICNAAGENCKDVGNKGRWTVKPKNGLRLDPKRGPSSIVEGRKPGVYTVTVKLGNVTGTTTVTVNEPPSRNRAEVAERRIVAVPEHPVTIAGKPFVMAFYSCPRGIDLESVTAGWGGRYGFVRNDGRPRRSAQAETPLPMQSAIDALLNEGCEPAPPVNIVPDEGFGVLHTREELVLLMEEDDADGFFVRFIFADGTSLFPSHYYAYFGGQGDPSVFRSLDDFGVDDEGQVPFDRITDQLLLDTPVVGPPAVLPTGGGFTSPDDGDDPTDVGGDDPGAGNWPPIAEITAPQLRVTDEGLVIEVAAGEPVELDGSASLDPDDEPIEYFWRSSPAAEDAAAPPESVREGTSERFTFESAEPGEYTVQLTVNDDEFAADFTTVQVRVSAAADAPREGDGDDPSDAGGE